MSRPAPYRLVVLRHGQSEWNAAGLFTGWENAHLTAHGELEAARAGTLLAEHGVLPAFAHTSLLRRTIRTTDLALAAADRDWIPVRRSWRLNGRHYGALQGRYKADVLRQYGEEQFRLWRRSYDVPPPPFDAASWSAQSADPRYLAAAARGPAPHRIPGGCLGPAAAVLAGRDRPGSAGRRMRARRLAWQHAAGAGQAARIHPGRPDRRAGHPHRHPAGLRARTGPAPGRPRRSVPRSARRPRRHRGHQEPARAPAAALERDRPEGGSR